MTAFFACFIPLLVAIDPLGVIPLYLGMTKGMTRAEIRRVIFLTISTALTLALAFLFLGKGIFIFLGISVDDFKIAGGVILLLVALKMVLSGHESDQTPWDKTVGVVPLGVPLIVGPASITTMLILSDTHGLGLTLASLVANLVVVALTFVFSRSIARVLGHGGMVALSKIVGLFLAAIAIMMMRVGIQGAFGL
ncbi:MAG TPA: MarC family protein [bacterium]|nr:MarC family protein [bacterium]